LQGVAAGVKGTEVTLKVMYTPTQPLDLGASPSKPHEHEAATVSCLT
jgi:hypothetical protein